MPLRGAEAVKNPRVRFVGVDLAWTERGGTGVCAVEQGLVVASGRLAADREILDWLEPYAGGDVVVAIDAPLIVRNATGRRECERAISRRFGAHHAAAHSSNLGLPAFRAGVRGERIARELGLSIDPLFEPGSSVRCAIEVYPHPAIVALFDLPEGCQNSDAGGTEFWRLYVPGTGLGSICAVCLFASTSFRFTRARK